MPTRPTTRPVAAPTAVAFPVRSRSRHTHVTNAVAAAVLVFVNARAASPFAASAEPALNPNQPNHRSPAPSSTRSEEHTSELQSQSNIVCRLLLEKKKQAC